MIAALQLLSLALLSLVWLYLAARVVTRAVMRTVGESPATGYVIRAILKFVEPKEENES